MTAPTPAPIPKRRPTAHALGRAFVALLAIGPALPTLRALFIYDDTTIIRDNALLRGWGALTRVWFVPYWPADGVDALGLYRPLQLALLALVWNVGDGSPRMFHAYALALAAGVALGAWWMIRQGVQPLAALVGVALFAAHPLHVEAVASVANTSELVVTLCEIGMFAMLRPRAAARDHPARDWWQAAGIGLLAACALAAKESGLLALPLAAITAWGWSPKRTSANSFPQFLREKARPVLASALGVALVLLARYVVLGAAVSHGSIAAQGLGGLSASQRVTAMMSLWPRIAGLLLWPTSIAPYYGPSVFPDHRTALALLSGGVVASLLTLAVIAARKGERRPLVAASWVALSYLPAANLFAATGQILSDRTLYGATLGLTLLVAWLLDLLPRFARRVAAVILALVVARATIYSTHYAIAWTNHRALWTRLVEVAPTEHLGYKLLGMDARARGDTARALELLGRALAMAPTDRQIRFEYGQALYASARYDEAVRTLTPLMRDDDARGEAGFVALYLEAVGRASGSQAVADSASPLMHSASAPVAALFRGAALEQLRRPAAADSAYAAGLRASPRDSALLARRKAISTSPAAR